MTDPVASQEVRVAFCVLGEALLEVIMNIELREIVELKAEEFKKKEYSQLQQIVEKKGEYFQVEYKNKKYNFDKRNFPLDKRSPICYTYFVR